MKTLDDLCRQLSTGEFEFSHHAFKRVVERNIGTSISGGESQLSESFTLSFRKGTWEYGTAKGGYNLDKNVKV